MFINRFLGFFLVLFFSNYIAISATRTSIASGDWNQNATWDCGCTPANSDDVVIAAGHTVKLVANGAGTTVNNLTISSSGIIDGNSKNLTIDGNVDIDGKIIDVKVLNLDGSGATIDGLGSITLQNNGASLDFNASMSIVAGASLIITNSTVTIKGNYTITNNGTLYFNADLTGTGGSPTFTNATNASVNFGKDVSSITLNASASGNTVTYYESGNQNVFQPSSSYYNLIVSGGAGDVKTLTSDLTILNDLTINSATLDVTASPYNLTIGGDWINNGAFIIQTGTVTFNGSSNQSITKTSGETFYNLTVNKSGGTLNLSNNITVNNELTLTSGNIDCDSYVLTLGFGTGVGEAGTLTRTSGTIIGWYEKYIDAAGAYTFPVGTSGNYRPATITYTATGFVAGSHKARFVAEDPGGSGLSIDDDPGIGIDSVYNRFTEGYWDFIAANGFACTDYDISLVADGFSSVSSGTADISDPKIITRDDENTAFDESQQEGTHDAAPVWNTVQRNTITKPTLQFAIGSRVVCVAPVWGVGTPSGDQDVCAGDNGDVYTATSANVTDYIWSVNGGTIISENDAVGTATIDWGATGTVTEVTVQLQNGCMTTGARTLAVTVHAVAPESITGKVNVPSGGTKTYFTTAIGGYTYDWGATGGTVDAESANNATVTWGAVNPSAELCVTATHGVCAASNTHCIDVNVYQVIKSIQSGDWTDPNTWDCNCDPDLEIAANRNVMIMNTHTVVLDGTNKNPNHTVINTGGILDINGKTGFDISGDLTVDGELTNTGTARDIVFSSIPSPSTPEIDGYGIITIPGKKLKITTSNTNIIGTTNLSLQGNLEIGTSINVSNSGTFRIIGDLQGTSATTSDFVNEANSELKVTGTLFEGATAGDLTATAAGNLVSYNGDAAQNVKSTSYYNLAFEDVTNNSTKTLLNVIDVDNDLLIDGALLDVTASNYQINVGGNWTNTGTFNEQNGTVIFDGTAATTITNSAGEQFYNIKFSKPANTEITLSGVVSIATTLDLSGGVISTGADSIIVLNNAPGSVINYDNTSFVNGKLTRYIASNTDTYPLPIGKGTATTDYYRVDYVNNTITGVSFINASINSITEGGSDVDANLNPALASQDGTQFNDLKEAAQWDIRPNTAATGGSYGVRLYTANISGLEDNKFAVLKRPSNSTTYADWNSFEATTTIPAQGANGRTVASGYAERLGYTTFSKFGVAHAPSVLPIELLSFKAKCENENVWIEWVTSSEKNNEVFELQKSADGEKFNYLVEFHGAGTSHQKNNYSFIDFYDNENKFYRLKQIDFDGTTSYSNVIQADCKSSSVKEASFSVYPNPVIAGNAISMEWNNLMDESVLVVVRDMLGKEYYSKVVINEFNETFVHAVDIQNRLTPGIYLVIGASKNKLFNETLIVK